jgi:hypothetical protein
MTLTMNPRLHSYTSVPVCSAYSFSPRSGLVLLKCVCVYVCVDNLPQVMGGKNMSNQEYIDTFCSINYTHMSVQNST